MRERAQVACDAVVKGNPHGGYSVGCEGWGWLATEAGAVAVSEALTGLRLRLWIGACIHISTCDLSNSRLRFDNEKCGTGNCRRVQFSTSRLVMVIASLESADASSFVVSNMLGTHSPITAGWLPLRTLFNSAVT